MKEKEKKKKEKKKGSCLWCSLKLIYLTSIHQVICYHGSEERYYHTNEIDVFNMNNIPHGTPIKVKEIESKYYSPNNCCFHYQVTNKDKVSSVYLLICYRSYQLMEHHIRLNFALAESNHCFKSFFCCNPSMVFGFGFSACCSQ